MGKSRLGNQRERFDSYSANSFEAGNHTAASHTQLHKDLYLSVHLFTGSCGAWRKMRLGLGGIIKTQQAIQTLDFQGEFAFHPESKMCYLPKRPRWCWQFWKWVRSWQSLEGTWERHSPVCRNTYRNLQIQLEFPVVLGFFTSLKLCLVCSINALVILDLYKPLTVPQTHIHRSTQVHAN